MVQYLGLDYWKKCKEIANSDEEFRIKTKGFTASFTYGVTDKPEPVSYTHLRAHET